MCIYTENQIAKSNISSGGHNSKHKQPTERERER